MVFRILVSFCLLCQFALADNLHVNKAVFDCSAKDLSYIASRLRLIERTAENFKSEGEGSDFVLTIHSSCTPIVSNDAVILSSGTQQNLLKIIQKQLTSLMDKQKVDVRVCEIALEAHGIEKDEIMFGVHTTKNSFMDVIRLQNSGYALFMLND